MFTLKSPPRIFGRLFLAEIFEKVSFDPYSRFSHDVTKTQTKKLSILLSFMRYYST